MHKVSILFVAAIVIAGCSKPEVRNSNATPSPTVVASAPKDTPSTTATAAPGKAPTPVTGGEKVEKPIDLTFEPGGLPSDWQWIDPDSEFSPTERSTKDGFLKLDVPSTKDMYGENRTAPRLLKAINGDFEIETRVRFDPKDSYQGAGILVFRNDSNYFRLERGFGGVGADGSGIRLDVREDEGYEPLATPEKFPTSAKVVELKVRRAGGEFTAFWREPEKKWIEVAKYSAKYPPDLMVGIIACNTADPITASFDYIKLRPAEVATK